jgi:hypothetical protein
VGGANRHTQIIGAPDGEHGGNFSSRALSVGQMRFADLLTDSNHDPLPADHSSHPER